VSLCAQHAEIPHVIEKSSGDWKQHILDHCTPDLLAFPHSRLARTNDLTMQAEKTSPNFLYLPAELHNQIVGEMDFPSALNLSKTNRYFRRTVDATNKPVPSGFCRELDKLSSCRQFWNHFVCYKCRCIKPSTAFVKKQIKKKRDVLSGKHRNRSCFDCSVSSGAFGEGQVKAPNGGIYCIVRNPMGVNVLKSMSADIESRWPGSI